MMAFRACYPFALALLLLLAADRGSARVLAQDVPPVAVEVTAIFEENVYLDKGWAEGVCSQDVVLIMVEPDRTIAVKVRSVSRNGSRCVPIEGIESIRVGMTGHVDLTQRLPILSPTSLEDRQTYQPNSEGIAPVDYQQGRSQPGAIERVHARVTATSGGSVYLDVGRDAGLRPGDEVTLFPASDGIVNGTIQSVASSSARCTILSGQSHVDIGTRAEVLIPTDRRTLEQESPAPRASVPEHPPWSATPEDWDQEQPLLAPAYAMDASERERQLHGRLFASYHHTLNQLNTQDQYSLGRVGASMWMENPFRRGGALHVDGELNRRGVFLADDFDDVQGPGRLDRLSYSLGGSETQPLRFEIGRFLSYEFPEFGVLDGTELVYRTAAGHRIGASVGLLPEPFPNLVVRDDLQLAAFYRWVRDPEETLSSGVGFQKTWHKGTPDRDLLIWSTDYDPNQHFSVHSTIWVDFYDSRDRLKSTRAEVTQAILQPILRINPRHGIGAHVSSIRWPQLQRRDYSPFVQTQVVGDHVFRWGLFTWHDLGERTRVDGRVDQWHDQSHQSGTSWEGRVAFRDWLYDHGEVAFTVFTTQGIYSSGPGGRVSLNRRFPWCFASLWYDIANYRLIEPAGAMQPRSDLGVLLQHSVRANLDFTISSDKSVSLFTDYRFGHSQDAISAGVFLQKRL